MVKVRKDVGSGKGTEDREGYQELLADIKAGAIDAVIVYKLDRLSRNIRDVYDFIDLTRERNVEFISVTESFDTTTAMGRAMLNIAAVFAQLTRETIAENVRNGLHQRASKGHWTGPPPLGYTYVNGQGLVINPDEAATVRYIFELYGADKLGTRKLAERLNQEGVPTPRGGHWTADGVSNILRHPVYIGKVRYGAIESDGHHEPIVPVKTFDPVQQRLASRRRETVHPRTLGPDYLLSGFIVCGKCSRRMRAYPKTRTQKWYRCSGNARVGEGACRGTNRQVRLLEDLVVGQIKTLAADEQMQQMALEQVQALAQQDAAPTAGERKRLERELDKVQEGFHRWADQLDAGTIGQEEFKERIGKLRERRQAVERRLAELEAAAVEQEQVKVVFEKVQGVLKDFDGLWEQGTPEERKELVRAVAERVTVGRETMVVKLRFLPEVTVALPPRKGRGRPRKSLTTS